MFLVEVTNSNDMSCHVLNKQNPVTVRSVLILYICSQIMLAVAPSVNEYDVFSILLCHLNPDL
jgi:hypothetical protein